MTDKVLKTRELTIRGKPVAKARARYVNTKRGVRTYDPQKDKADVIKLQIVQQMAPFRTEEPLAGAIAVEMTFHTPMPKSFTAAKKRALQGTHNFKRPDVDNYAKMYLDCMNEWIYNDDGQVAELKASKRYSLNPRTEITIRELGVEIEQVT